MKNRQLMKFMASFTLIFLLSVLAFSPVIHTQHNTGRTVTKNTMGLQFLHSAATQSKNFSTYLGSPGDELGYDISVDNEGNLFICGTTDSELFPTTEGAYNRSLGGDSDAFVCKLSADGSSLMWSTFIGSKLHDSASSIEVLSDGSVVVCGDTEGAAFPTTEGAYSRTHSGNKDCFVCKISSDGSELLFSTFIGGSGADYGSGVHINENGDICFAGKTTSNDFPMAGTSYNTTYGENSDVFAGRLSSDGSTLSYSTYLGAGGFEDVREFQCAPDGGILLTGITNSKMFPTTAGAYNDSLYEGTYDMYFTRFNADGSELSFSTFIGGSGHDHSYSFAMDAEENIVILGKTYSEDFPVSAGVHDDHYDSSSDNFLFKLKNDGSAMLASTFYGGSAAESAGAVSIDASGNIFFSGITGSSDLNITDDAMQKEKKGSYDLFIGQMSADLSELIYATYIGSSGVDTPYFSCIDSQGYLNVVGTTDESDFPTTDGAFNRTHGGERDVIVLKFPIVTVDGNGFPYWILVAMGAVAAVVVTFIFIIRKRNKSTSS